MPASALTPRGACREPTEIAVDIPAYTGPNNPPPRTYAAWPLHSYAPSATPVQRGRPKLEDAGACDPIWST
jgi:hypothetical protein